VDIARNYDAAGAAAISVLTEEDYFAGSARLPARYQGDYQIAAVAQGFYLR
jgi:indole-3-glycerol phosphate synthase